MKLNKYAAFVTLGVFAIICGVIYLNEKENDPKIAEKILNEKGFSEVVITDFNFWCPKGTPIRKEFTAKDKNGQEVEGSLCANSWFVSDKIDTKQKYK